MRSAQELPTSGAGPSKHSNSGEGGVVIDLVFAPVRPICRWCTDSVRSSRTRGQTTRLKKSAAAMAYRLGGCGMRPPPDGWTVGGGAVGRGPDRRTGSACALEPRAEREEEALEDGGAAATWQSVGARRLPSEKPRRRCRRQAIEGNRQRLHKAQTHCGCGSAICAKPRGRQSVTYTTGGGSNRAEYGFRPAIRGSCSAHSA